MKGLFHLLATKAPTVQAGATRAIIAVIDNVANNVLLPYLDRLCTILRRHITRPFKDQVVQQYLIDCLGRLPIVIGFANSSLLASVPDMLGAMLVGLASSSWHVRKSSAIAIGCWGSVLSDRLKLSINRRFDVVPVLQRCRFDKITAVRDAIAKSTDEWATTDETSLFNQDPADLSLVSRVDEPATNDHDGVPVVHVQLPFPGFADGGKAFDQDDAFTSDDDQGVGSQLEKPLLKQGAASRQRRRRMPSARPMKPRASVSPKVSPRLCRFAPRTMQRTVQELTRSTAEGMSDIVTRIASLETRLDQVTSLLAKLAPNELPVIVGEPASTMRLDAGQRSSTVAAPGQWDQAMTLVNRDELAAAYRLILTSGDDLHLIRLMVRTGAQALERMGAGNTLSMLFARLIRLLHDGAFVDLILGWTQALIDRLDHPSCVDALSSGLLAELSSTLIAMTRSPSACHADHAGRMLTQLQSVGRQR